MFLINKSTPKIKRQNPKDMNAKLLSRDFLSTVPFVFRNEIPVLPVKAEQVSKIQNDAFDSIAVFGRGYLCGKALILAAANSLSHFLPPHNGSSR